MPHIPEFIRFIPSRPGMRKSIYREPGSDDVTVVGRHGIFSARGGLHGVVGLGPGQHAFRTRRIVTVGEASLAVGFDDEIELAEAKSLLCSFRIENLHFEELVLR